MNDLINQFPNKSRKEKRAVMYVPDSPDDPSFTKKFWNGFKIVFGFIGFGIVLLIVMGLLKLCGVKVL